MADGTTRRFERIARKAARVVELWPTMPFWLRRRHGRQVHLALPGAAVSAAATIAALLFEPALHFSKYRSIPFDFLGEPRVFLLLSLLAPLATFAVLDPGTRRYFPTGGSSWLGVLPIVGLFAIADAQADLDAARRDRRPGLPLPKVRLGSRPKCRSPLPQIAGAAFDRFRSGLFRQGLLFASHLGWLFGAVAFLVGQERSRVWLLVAFGCLHLLAMASSLLMMTHQRDRSPLLADWGHGLVPCCMLLPVPLNLIPFFFWFLPQSKKRRDSLTAFAFTVKRPLHRLTAGRALLPARSGAEVRQGRELPWLELHRGVFFFQMIPATGILTRWGGAEVDAALVRLWWGALAATFLAALTHSLLIWGFSEKTFRWMTALGRVPGISFVLVLALPVGGAMSMPAPKALGVLATALVTGAMIMLLAVPLEILLAPGRLRRLPPSLVRAVCLAIAGVAIHFLRQTVSAEPLLVGLKAAAAASFLVSPLLLYIAERIDGPAVARSRWLAIPFSALLLPFLRGPASPLEGRAEPSA